MPKIVVTGGCGYIGAHTILSLVEAGYDVLCIDDNSRSSPEIMAAMCTIAGKTIPHYRIDLKEFLDLQTIFRKHSDIVGVIHFAAYKAVGESVDRPLFYYENNLIGLINVLKCVEEFGVREFVFSSSCTVYGEPAAIPVTEDTPFGVAECPYGATKQMGERIIEDFVKRPGNTQNACILRYFNPAGAHPSIRIGEDVRASVRSLTSAIVHCASSGKELVIFGSDYGTRDGTCLRDFIHVCDIADAHVKALTFLSSGAAGTCNVFNLGSGEGNTVLEAVHVFESVAPGILKWRFGERRKGDIGAIYSDNTKVRNILKWEPKRTLRDIMETAWRFQLRCIAPARD